MNLNKFIYIRSDEKSEYINQLVHNYLNGMISDDFFSNLLNRDIDKENFKYFYEQE